MSEKYKPGDFKWCNPGEAVFVMQNYLSKLGIWITFDFCQGQELWLGLKLTKKDFWKLF